MKPSERIEEIRLEMLKGKGLTDASKVTFIISALIQYLDEEYDKQACSRV
jgi:hypothetical protein